MSSWYFVNNKAKTGPIEFTALQQAVKDGAVQRDTLVWTEGFGQDWRRADQVDALAGVLRQSPPPLPDEQESVSSRARPAAAGAGPSATVYVAAWVTAFLLSSALNGANFIVSGLVSENALPAGVANYYIGALIAACAFVFVFEALFRQVRMQAVWRASWWLGAASLSINLISTLSMLLTGEEAGLRRHELNFLFLTGAAPLLFWAVVWANFWRMARSGRIYPSRTCPRPDTAPKDSPATRVGWLVVCLIALSAVYARLLFVASG